MIKPAGFLFPLTYAPILSSAAIVPLEPPASEPEKPEVLKTRLVSIGPLTERTLAAGNKHYIPLGNQARARQLENRAGLFVSGDDGNFIPGKFYAGKLFSFVCAPASGWSSPQAKQSFERAVPDLKSAAALLTQSNVDPIQLETLMDRAIPLLKEAATSYLQEQNPEMETLLEITRHCLQAAVYLAEQARPAASLELHGLALTAYRKSELYSTDQRILFFELALTLKQQELTHEAAVVASEIIRDDLRGTQALMQIRNFDDALALVLQANCVLLPLLPNKSEERALLLLREAEIKAKQPVVSSHTIIQKSLKEALAVCPQNTELSARLLIDLAQISFEQEDNIEVEMLITQALAVPVISTQDRIRAFLLLAKLCAQNAQETTDNTKTANEATLSLYLSAIDDILCKDAQIRNSAFGRGIAAKMARLRDTLPKNTQKNPSGFC